MALNAEKPRPESGHLPEVAGVMLKLGFIGFGGPAAHLALMRQEMVVRRKWLSEQDYLDLIGTASVLPGPTSTQVGILLGRRRAGWPGLVVGGVCFIAPAMVIVCVLAWAYTRWGTTTAGSGLLYGIKPVVVAIIVQALYGLARTAVKGRLLLALGGAAAFAAFLAGVDVLVVMAGVGAAVTLSDNLHHPERPSVAAVMPAISVLPALSEKVAQVRYHPSLLAVLGEFLKLGCIVFGSGYVLLAFLRGDLVGHHGWITSRQLLDAVSVGQFTPGPVFTTATFIGYLSAGLTGAIVATVAIFAPSFVMMAGLSPIVPRLRKWPWSASALDGVNVAALGLMAGVTVDLARTGIVDPLTGVLGALTLVVLVRFHPNSMWVLGAGAAVGLLHAFA